jgi:hypothetical protein
VRRGEAEVEAEVKPEEAEEAHGGISLAATVLKLVHHH